MSPEAFSILQLLVALCATLSVSFMAKMSPGEVLISNGIPAAAVLTTFTIIMIDQPDSGALEFLFLGAIIHLLCTALIKAAMFPKKMLPPLNEGGVLLMFLTFLFCLLSIENLIARTVLLLAAGILGIVLLVEVLSDDPLPENSRFFLGVFVSVMSLTIFLHQLSFLDEVHQLAQSKHHPLSVLMQSFSVQVTGFWALFHGIRLILLLPLSQEGGYKERLHTMAIPSFIESISPESVPRRTLLVIGALLAVPLAFNAALGLLEPQTTVFYSLMLSSVLAGAIGNRLWGVGTLPQKPK